MRLQRNCQAMKWKPQQTPLTKTDLLIRNKDAKHENVSLSLSLCLSLSLFLVFGMNTNMNMNVSLDRGIDRDVGISTESVWCGGANRPFISHSSLSSRQSLLFISQSAYTSAYAGAYVRVLSLLSSDT